MKNEFQFKDLVKGLRDNRIRFEKNVKKTFKGIKIKKPLRKGSIKKFINTPLCKQKIQEKAFTCKLQPSKSLRKIRLGGN